MKFLLLTFRVDCHNMWNIAWLWVDAEVNQTGNRHRTDDTCDTIKMDVYGIEEH